MSTPPRTRRDLACAFKRDNPTLNQVADAAPGLAVRGLMRHFGGNAAVNRVSFDVAAGEMLALIGPNGAGKSTVFNLLGGQLAADQGSVRLYGHELLGLAPHHIARLGVGRTFQIAATFASFSVVENVQTALLAQTHKRAGVFVRLWRNARRDGRAASLDLLAQVGMRDQADRPCSALAYGDIKRLELAVALAARPRLLLMDEPTAGMAAPERQALMALVRDLARARGLAVLFTEHSMDVVFGYADRIVVLARGEVIAQGSPNAVRQNARVRAAYFGSGQVALQDAGIQLQAVARAAPHTDVVQSVREGGAGDSPGAASPALLEVERLNAWYGGAHVLHDVTLSVARGQAVALMGRNGAGKSTTLKAIMGLVAQRCGALRVLGEDVSRRAPFQAARAGLGYVPEDRRVFTGLSVRENLLTARQPARRWPDGAAAPHWTLERVYDLFPHLASLDRRAAGQLSGGEQQMLTVARTLMGNPLLILLDEPSEGVAPIVVEQMITMIQTLKTAGVSILLSEQNLPFAAHVCGRAYILEKGTIRHTGDMTSLMRNDTVLRAYVSI